MEKLEDDKHQKESKLVTIICIIIICFILPILYSIKSCFAVVSCCIIIIMPDVKTKFTVIFPGTFVEKVTERNWSTFNGA